MKSTIKIILYVFVVCSMTCLYTSCSSGSDYTDPEEEQQEQEAQDKETVQKKLVGTWNLGSNVALTLKSDYTFEIGAATRATESCSGTYTYSNGVLTLKTTSGSCTELGLTAGQETSFSVTINESSDSQVSSITLTNTTTQQQITVTKEETGDNPSIPEYNAPNWKYRLNSSFEGTMTVKVVLPDSLISTQAASSDEMAVFCDDDVRGTLQYYEEPAVWMGMVHGKDNDVLKIGYYSSKNKHLYYATPTFSFTKDAQYGTPNNPITLGLSIVTK